MHASTLPVLLLLIISKIQLFSENEFEFELGLVGVEAGSEVAAVAAVVLGRCLRVLDPDRRPVNTECRVPQFNDGDVSTGVQAFDVSWIAVNECKDFPE